LFARVALSRIRQARTAAFIAACAAALAACAAHEERRTRDTTATAHDDFGAPVVISPAARRVVSLNPTTTETIFAIGAGDRLVGRSRWDSWPAAAQRVPALGDGIRPNVERIVAAHPDLVLLYATEDNRPAALQLRAAGIRVVALRIDTPAQFDASTRLIGRVLGDSAQAALVADTVASSVARVRAATATLPHPTVVWPLMNSTPMVVGGGSFMNDLLAAAGARNVYADLPQPSPTVSIEDVVHRNPTYVIRGGEGAPTTPLGGVWQALPAVQAGRIISVPTDLVLRPSVQMGAAAAGLARALHPELRLP
jgi:ABC-type Fe3+-hydroxamate transport system substrate-binding protein